jgi:hypothetical protein
VSPATTQAGLSEEKLTHAALTYLAEPGDLALAVRVGNERDIISDTAAAMLKAVIPLAGSPEFVYRATRIPAPAHNLQLYESGKRSFTGLMWTV